MKALFFSILFAIAGIAHAEVVVRVGEISDKRTTGKFFAGLEIKLLISGAQLADAKGMRVKVESAIDQTGKDITSGGNKAVFGDEFEPLAEPFGFDDDAKKPGEYEVKLDLGNPARAAKTVKITGKIELLLPKADPASIITANPVKDAGKPLVHPALKAAGVELTLTEAMGDEVGYKMADPKNKVAAVEYCAADGKPLDTSGRSSMGFAGQKTNTVSLKNKLPAGALVKIFLLTEKSVLQVPLKLDAVALP